MAAGMAPLVIETFHAAYTRLLAGATGYISQAEALPVDALPDESQLTPAHARAGEDALNRTVVCKLNGGLGTGMGLDGPKSLLPVKAGLSFLDITVRQVLHLRQTYGARLPLLLMNSFATRDASLALLAEYPALAQSLPFDFLQNKVPKVRKADLAPAHWPADPEKEWCPPGHGDIYPTLETNGLLERLLDEGYETLFVSNADNLGALVDPAILGYFVREGLPFLMEVAQRTPADSKGGHLARRPDGALILRESAQCPPEEMAQFQEIERYRFFNTNNLWINLPALQRNLEAHAGILELPLIRNEKPIDPTLPDSERVYQLETAMGSAIGLFDGAQALCVGRNRFAPVKKNSDLLALWSDAYVLTPQYHIEPAPERPATWGAPVVKLDDAYFGLIADLRSRFPHGAPSLLRARSLTVEGDVRFGRDVVVEGDVTVRADADPLHIPDGARLQG